VWPLGVVVRGVLGQHSTEVPVGAENPLTSCDLHVLVYEAAESVSSQWSECRSGRWGSGACGRLLMQRAERAMSVVSTTY